jgi:hypothetical protein
MLAAIVSRAEDLKVLYPVVGAVLVDVVHVLVSAQLPP